MSPCEIVCINSLPLIEHLYLVLVYGCGVLSLYVDRKCYIDRTYQSRSLLPDLIVMRDNNEQRLIPYVTFIYSH